MNGMRVALSAGLMVLLACESAPSELPDLSVATVTVAPTGRTLMAGESMQLTAYPKTADGTVLGGRRVDWSSDAAGVAALSANGVVRALTPGAARIVAEVEGRAGSVQVTVMTAPLQVATIEIMNAPARLEDAPVPLDRCRGDRRAVVPVAVERGATPALDVRALGVFEVRVEGVRLARDAWPYAKPKELLLLLLLLAAAGRAIRSDPHSGRRPRRRRPRTASTSRCTISGARSVTGSGS